MALTTFEVIKFKDDYKLTNTGNTNIIASINVESDDCTQYDKAKPNVIIEPGITKTIKLSYDGKYRIDLIDENSEVSEIKILHYYSLLTSIIADIQYLLCECDAGCTDCGDKSSECHQDLGTILKILSFQRLTHPQHAAFLEVVFNSLSCSIKELTNTLVFEQQTNGSASYAELLKKILSYYYLAFYHSEYKNVSSEEIEYINTKFQFNEISTCIDATLITEVQTKIDNMGTFTVINGAYVNQSGSVGDNTIERPNRVTTVLTMEMFTSQTTPPYTDPENDPADAIKIISIDGNNTGKYQVDNVDVVPEQIIDISVVQAERFVHVGPDQDSVSNDSIGFAVRDSGSGEWVS